MDDALLGAVPPRPGFSGATTVFARLTQRGSFCFSRFLQLQGVGLGGGFLSHATGHQRHAHARRAFGVVKGAHVGWHQASEAVGAAAGPFDRPAAECTR